MKKKFNIGDLVEGGFCSQRENFGTGIIIQKKNFAPQVNAYRVHWSNNHPTWESPSTITLVAKNAKV